MWIIINLQVSMIRCLSWYKGGFFVGENRIRMVLKLTPQAPERNYKIEELVATNLEGLASALIDAFIDTPDYEGETFMEAVKEIQAIIDGKYGEFVTEASGIIRQNHEVAAAIFISINRGRPLLTEVFTRKNYVERGMARSLIRNSVRALLELGYKELVLYCNPLNDRALKLYERLGFLVDTN